MSSDLEDNDNYDDYLRMLREERQREIDDELLEDFCDISSEYSPSKDRSLESYDFDYDYEEDQRFNVQGKMTKTRSMIL